jgi:hypothetical protein
MPDPQVRERVRGEQKEIRRKQRRLLVVLQEVRGVPWAISKMYPGLHERQGLHWIQVHTQLPPRLCGPVQADTATDTATITL